MCIYTLFYICYMATIYVIYIYIYIYVAIYVIWLYMLYMTKAPTGVREDQEGAHQAEEVLVDPRRRGPQRMRLQ